MEGSRTRREFLENIVLAAGSAALCKSAWAEAPRASTPLPNPKFYWGIGIENCWMAQSDPTRDGNRRHLDVFLQMQHYEKWKEDLNLLPSTGVN